MARTRGNKRLCLASQDPALPPTRTIPSPAKGETLALADYFDLSRSIEIDVGCGKGRFLLARARAFPETQFLGIERLDARVARIDVTSRRENLTNICTLKMDAVCALDALSSDSIAAAYFFFPDPWPKRRHHKYRLFTPPFADALHRILKSGGLLHVATDQLDYHARMKTLLDADTRFTPIPAFERTPDEYTDFEIIFRSSGKPIGASSYRKM